ncbi:hypothetical protein NQ176_g4598 [Zarea fungicola]|uniref:Uncharacterized protein n=1 Tax=Zarea fungicola TaxID=93591 RepID=A0ACC1NCJ9_9HYPO|nr:hypothetical protein NQ176_g4598 [Lecanicillium fungicola]
MSHEIVDPSAWSALEIGLPVYEMEPMQKFYCEGLAFKPEGHIDLPVAHIRAFRFGSCLLKLTLFLDPGQRPNPRKPDPSSIYITLRVANVDTMLDSCVALGASILVPATSTQTKTLNSVRFAIVADPMGNRIELVQGNAWYN